MHNILFRYLANIIWEIDIYSLKKYNNFINHLWYPMLFLSLIILLMSSHPIFLIGIVTITILLTLSSSSSCTRRNHHNQPDVIIIVTIILLMSLSLPLSFTSSSQSSSSCFYHKHKQGHRQDNQLLHEIRYCCNNTLKYGNIVKCSVW